MKMEVQGSGVLRKLREGPEQTPPHSRREEATLQTPATEMSSSVAAITQRVPLPLAELTVCCSDRS